jgi:hypothetical protein
VKTDLDFILIDKSSACLYPEPFISLHPLTKTHGTHGKVQSVMSECRRGSEQGNKEGVCKHGEWIKGMWWGGREEAIGDRRWMVMVI